MWLPPPECILIFAKIKREALKQNCSHYCVGGVSSARRRGILFHQTSRGQTFSSKVTIIFSLGCGRRRESLHLFGPVLSVLTVAAQRQHSTVCLLSPERSASFSCSFTICFGISLFPLDAFTNHRLLRKATIIRALVTASFVANYHPLALWLAPVHNNNFLLVYALHLLLAFIINLFGDICQQHNTNI